MSKLYTRNECVFGTTSARERVMVYVEDKNSPDGDFILLTVNEAREAAQMLNEAADAAETFNEAA